MLPDDHDAHRADPPGRVLRLPQERSHLQEPAGGHAVQDFRRPGGVLLPEGRLHHPAGRSRRHVLHHLEGAGARHHPPGHHPRGKVHPNSGQGRLFRREGTARG
uniref:(northern house mosquito) hypothetical protein n=1 Tax=Culex pipiens TaxID=7175 RepID=A0A8D8DGL4_CULPI